MEKIRVDVAWCENNFSASLGENVPGAVVFTADTFADLQKEAKESLGFHVEGMVADGDDVPRWLVDGDYESEYRFLDATSLLRAYEPFLSLAAISRASGINQHQLSHYGICPKCGEAIDRDFVVCPMCNTQVRNVCPTCHRPLNADWKVCPYCRTHIQ